jgi:hypothetical protein
MNLSSIYYYKNVIIMAKANKQTSTSVRIAKPKKKRPGVHSKKKSSNSKNSKNYLKKTVGQG